MHLHNAVHLAWVDKHVWTACDGLQAGGSWLGKVTAGWQAGRISNLDYLLYCNLAAGRSFNDLTQVCAPEMTHILPKLGLCAWLSASISCKLLKHSDCDRDRDRDCDCDFDCDRDCGCTPNL